ncbi:MAG: ABC transporter permease [Bacteroidota bacterium]
MVTNYLKVAFRKLWRHSVFALINIIGLSLGLISCTFILMYVQYERSFDNFRPSDLYRVAYYGYQHHEEVGKSAQVVPALAPALKQDMPDVADAARIVHTDPLMADPVMQVGDKSFRESRIYYADSSFLQMFSYTLIAGSANTALAMPDQVVISESMARKYFGDEDPIGQTMTFHRGERGKSELKVSAVFQDVPPNAHLHTDILVSFSTLKFHQQLDHDWGWGNFYTYIKLSPGVEPQTFESKIPAFLQKYLGDQIKHEAAAGYTTKYALQSIQNIHLDSTLWGEAERNGDRKTTDFLVVIAVFILVIAWVNYVNFTIAKSTENSKEVSVRKISGSNQWQLMGQLMTESLLVNLMSAIIAVAVIQLLLPILKTMIGLPAALEFGNDSLLVIALLAVAGIIIAGLYPAYVVSQLKPVSILKGRISRSALGVNLNRALIVFQFTASIVLIIGTLTIQGQLSFMRMTELGLSLDQTLIVKGPAVKDSTYYSHLDVFYDKATKLSGVENMATSSSVPGHELQWGRSFYRKEDPANDVGVNIIAVDEHFFDLFKASFVAGKNFTDGSPSNQDAVIFNETAARLLGYANPPEMVGETIIWDENERQQLPKRVVGVVKDFYQQSLKTEVGPIVFALKRYLSAPWAGEYYAFKISRGNVNGSIIDIHKVWSEVFPGNPFDYFFLEDFFDAQYNNEQNFGHVFGLFAGLAILIACLGLFGLTSYMTILRTKEIGIRKILGSSSLGIVRLLSRDFMLWVLIAFVLACPVSAYLMSQWLEQFAYRIEMSVWIFVLAGLICFVIALFTVSWKSWQAANINPTHALRYE